MLNASRRHAEWQQSGNDVQKIDSMSALTRDAYETWVACFGVIDCRGYQLPIW